MTWSCACGFGSDLPRFGSAWHGAHRAHHLAAFPTADDRTRRALDDVIAYAEKIERDSSLTADLPKG